MKIKSVSPFTEKVVKEFGQHSPKEVEKRLRLLKENAGWAETGVKKRITCINRISKLLESRKKKYATMISMEMGKPIKESLVEVERSAQVCDYFADNGEKLLLTEEVKTDFKRSYISLEPLGVVLGIMPWNYPFHQVLRFAIPQLLLGNRIVLKHSSTVPQCAFEIERVMNRALPEGVYSNLFITADEATKLVESKYIDGVAFTGSAQAGAKVAEAAGRSLKKSILELGGSDPFIVLKDADMEKCCAVASGARFRNAGQSCISAKRFIVEKEVADKFINNLVKGVESLKMGDPLDANTDIGPLARDDLRDRLHDYVKISVDMGAKVLAGGRPAGRKGFFYEPTVLVNVNENMPAFTEEIFGPIASVITAKNEKDALRIANSTEYGLGASVWTKDENKADLFAKRLDAGMVAINSPMRSDPGLPFGGVKKSGYGRELSHYALREFANVKAVMAN